MRVSHVNNETQIFDILNLVALLFNISQIQRVEKDGKIISYEKQHLGMLQMIAHLHYLVAS